MKGDISRQTFDRTKHYSAVVMQQGRVQLDADWNEQQDIASHRVGTVTVDAIGVSGAPNYAPGFEIKLDPTRKKLQIGAGRYYLDGFLCENEAEVDYEVQPDFFDPPTLNKLLQDAGATTAIVYLDVWQRHITPLDDPHILEPALGGPDTTTRLKTVWQVKILPVKTPQSDMVRLAGTLRRFQLDLTAYRDALNSQGGGAPRLDGTNPVGDIQAWMDRLSSMTPLAGTPLSVTDGRMLYFQLKQLRSDINQLNREIPGASAAAVLSGLTRLESELGNAIHEVTCHDSFAEWLELTSTSGAALTPVLTPTTAITNPCVSPPEGGFFGSDNQLYRVEIHQAGELTSPAGVSGPTFKWSRDNGIVTFAIERISGRQVKVTDLGLDATMSLARDQWVEIIDDRLELAGLPGQLVQIDIPPDPATLVVTMKQDVTQLFANADGVDLTRHPKLRRWEQSGDATGLPVSETATVLENGISAVFSPGVYKTGDYWLLPARSNGRIDWPPFETPSTPRSALPPMGVIHHYNPLAIVELNDDETLTLHDCRRVFAPLASPAMRVVATNWENDEAFPVSRLLNEGLMVWFDAEPFAYSLNPGSVIVTLEAPVTEGPPGSRRLARSYSALSVILDGEIHVVANNLNWALDLAELRKVFGRLDFLSSTITGMRMRVTLKGHVIHSDRHVTPLHLDGQSFGIARRPATGGQSPTMSLTFPSGSGDRASDFESWFYLLDDSYGYGYGSDSTSIGGHIL